MHRIDGDGHVAGLFAAENALTGQHPTVITAQWLNAVQEEIAGVVLGAGLALDKANNGQLLAAIRALVNAVVAGAPGALDTLNELARALGNDANFAVTVTNALASKANAGGSNASGTWPISITGRAANGVPAGTVIAHAGTTAPAGFLTANGAAVSRSVYAELFAAIRVAHGEGDGATTFNLPDLRNRVVLGAGGLYVLGAKGGSKDAVVVEHQHTGQTGAGGLHSHALTTYFDGGIGMGFRVTGDDGSYQNLVQYNVPGVEPAGEHQHSFTTSLAGQSGLNANLPPYIALTGFIKF